MKVQFFALLAHLLAQTRTVDRSGFTGGVFEFALSSFRSFLSCADFE